MAATNWTIIRREKASNQMLTFNLEAKWTYKTALGIAIESNNDGKLTMDALNLQQKVYNMLNRIAVAGGTFIS